MESLSTALPFRSNRDVSPDAGHIARQKSVDIELAWQNFEKNVFNLPSWNMSASFAWFLPSHAVGARK